jgi:hypothetical protein
MQYKKRKRQDGFVKVSRVSEHCSRAVRKLSSKSGSPASTCISETKTLRARLGDSPAYLSGNPRVRFCVRDENVCFLPRAAILALISSSASLRHEKDSEGVCFFALWSFSAVPPARLSKAGSILGGGLAQNFLKPQLRSSGSVRRPSQQRVELALLSTYWLTQ